MANEYKPISTSPAGAFGNGLSEGAALSQNGQSAAFASDALNLSSSAFGLSAVYLKNTQTGALTLISADANGTPANSNSDHPDISGDGRYVVFQSYAANLAAGDKNNDSDVFLKDTQTGALQLISGVSGKAGDSGSGAPEISADGRWIVFQSQASNFAADDLNGSSDIFLADRQTGQLTLISRNAQNVAGNQGSSEPSLSANGEFAAFTSEADNLVAGDKNVSPDVFVKNIATGTVILASAAAQGQSAQGRSDSPALSADGAKIVFRSFASDLLANTKNDGFSDIYVKDLKSGALLMVNQALDGGAANGAAWVPAISPDGKYVAFVSDASNLVAGDNNGVADVFVRNLATGETVRLDGPTGATGDSASPAFSGDGSVLAFSRWASDSATDPANSQNLYALANPFAAAGSGQNYTLSADFAQVKEDGKTAVSFTVTASQAPAQTVSIPFTLSGTADKASDYQGTLTQSGIFTLAANASSASLSFTATPDTLKEGDETVTVTLGNPSDGGKLLTASQTVKILDAATTPVIRSYSLTVDSSEVDEDGASEVTFTVTVDKAPAQAVSIPFTLDGSADKGADYQGSLTQTGVFTLPANQTRASLSFTATPDQIVEDDETVSVTLGAPSDNGTVAQASQTVTIHNLIPAWQGTEGADVFNGGLDADEAYGLGGNDTLNGNGGDDALDGGEGADKLAGGKGADSLAGGGGKDIFVFKKGDSSANPETADVIEDLEAGDKIDLSSISKRLNFIKAGIADDFDGTGLKLSASKYDAYIARVEGELYLVYETSAKGSTHEVVLIGDADENPGAWSAKLGVLTIG
jgi:Tol biopolymer transport system component